MSAGHTSASCHKDAGVSAMGTTVSGASPGGGGCGGRTGGMVSVRSTSAEKRIEVSCRSCTSVLFASFSTGDGHCSAGASRCPAAAGRK